MTPSDILEQQAIDAAINGSWQQSTLHNKQILKNDPHNIDACLRLGYAYLQLSNLKEAQKYYRKALRIQPKNNIATEHLEKIQILEKKKKAKIKNNNNKFAPDLFLEIPSKTRTIQLVNLGKKEDLAALSVGVEVRLKVKKRRLEVRSVDNEYIGTLPDDISKRLLYFIKESSRYKTFIKEIDLSQVAIFIVEITKGKRVKHYPSFPSNPHVMLTDIHQLEAEDKEGEGDQDDDATDIEDEQWGDFEDEEDKEDLKSYVDVEEEEEE